MFSAARAGHDQAVYNVKFGFYTRLSTLVALVYALVIATDWVSDRLRYRALTPAAAWADSKECEPPRRTQTT